MMLERLIYRSQARGGNPAADLDAILRASLWNNARHGITGVLGRCGATYVQLLEGAPEALDDLLARLRSDPRHTDLRIMERRRAGRRLLPGWTLARADLDDGATEPVAGVMLARGDAEGLVDLLVERVRRGETSVA